MMVEYRDIQLADGTWWSFPVQQSVLPSKEAVQRIATAFRQGAVKKTAGTETI